MNDESAIAFDNGLPYSDDETSPAMQVMLARATADDTVETLLTSRSHRQIAWDQHLESVDQKHAELMAIQWKLIREQVGKLAQEMSVIQSDVTDLRTGSRRALSDMEKHLRDTDLQLVEERSQRLTLSESVEHWLSKSKADLEAEVKQRSAADAETLARIEHVSAELAVKHAEQVALERHVKSFEDEIHASALATEALRESVLREADERKSTIAPIFDELHELRTALRREIRERTEADEELSLSLGDRCDQDRGAFTESLATLRSSCATLHSDLQQHRGELPALHSRIDEVVTTVASHAKDRAKSVEKGNCDAAAAQQRLAKRFDELSAVVERTSSTQDTMVEEVEEMLKNFRARMRAQLNEQVEAARVAREALDVSLEERFEKEAAGREAQQHAVMSDLQVHKSALGARMDCMQRSLQELEQKRGVDTESEWEGSSKVHEDLCRQIKDLRETFLVRLAEERSAREACDTSIEDHLEYMDRFFSEAREIFVQKHPRPRQMLRKPSLPGRNSAWMSLTSTPRSVTPVGIRAAAANEKMTTLEWPAS